MTFDRDTCPNCEAAALRQWSEFMLGCKGCCARGVGRGPHYRRRVLAGVQGKEYRELLRQLDLTDDEVKAAAAVDFEMRAVA